MNITRRSFLQLSGMTAVSLSLLGYVDKAFGQSADSGLFAVPVESLGNPLNYLTRAHFEPFAGTAMRAAAGGKGIDLTLSEVKDLTRGANVKRGFNGESYSLVFRSSSRQRLSAGEYAFDHANLGKFTISLVPFGKNGANYEAVINRIAN